jgi:uncharacterized protein YndB with AHSA1/START domain
MDDIATQIGAVKRQVIFREHQGRPAQVVVATQRYPTSIQDTWDALTSAERIPRWFLPISGDLREGGRYQLQGNAGGVISQCKPPHHLALTWEYAGDVSWVDVRLTGEAGATLLELQHVAHVPDEMWAKFGPGAVGVGWDSGLLGLFNHLTRNGGVSPETSAAWMQSAEGKRFFTLSSEDWCRASIAAGTDAAAARAAADRTTDAYTASPGSSSGG